MNMWLCRWMHEHGHSQQKVATSKINDSGLKADVQSALAEDDTSGAFNGPLRIRKIMGTKDRGHFAHAQ